MAEFDFAIQKFTADDIVEAQERSDDGSDRKVSVENRRSHAGHVLQGSRKSST